jgi:protein brassinosteroid insensitive 1
VLDLSSNTFSGSIPSSLCQDPDNGLRILYLQNNYLTGVIPDAFSNCSKLESLDLSLNLINGSLPASLGELGNLRDLIMWQNELEGEIPSSLSNMHKLEHLILDYNGLAGSIPTELAKCKDLKWISLASNRLSGPIPSWFGQLSNLAVLMLSNNSFSGPIPPELGDCQSLVWLDLNSNLINGSIPAELAKQSGKMNVGIVIGRPYVYLRNDELSNQCRGKGSLLEFTSIRSEDLRRMPSKKLCNFTRMYMGNTEYTFNKNGSMVFLDLSFNQLDSEIPKELGSMYYLMIMNLGHNLLSGLIPSELAGAKKLAVLDLSHNQLEGQIPNSFMTLSLSEINLSNNLLNGSIPELGSLATFPKAQYENNTDLCGFPLPKCGPYSRPSSSDDGQSHRRKGTLAGTVAMGILFSLFCIFGLVIIVIVIKTHIKKKSKEQPVSGFLMANNYRAVSYFELVRATNNFNGDNLLGDGRFGKVFKCQLDDGETVAVKVLNMDLERATMSFDVECRVLHMARHRNLVRILTTCSSPDFKALVLQYMPNGSLDEWLFSSDRRRLGLVQRVNIMLDVAWAVTYLHHEHFEVVLHCDLNVGFIS